MKDKTFAQLFEERTPLYEKWASVSVDGTQLPEKIISDIQAKLESYA